jgi:hypothetical protein
VHGREAAVPTARLPVIRVLFIAVVSAYPDIVTAWTGCTMLPDANRWRQLYHDLSLNGYLCCSDGRTLAAVLAISAVQLLYECQNELIFR